MALDSWVTTATASRSDGIAARLSAGGNHSAAPRRRSNPSFSNNFIAVRSVPRRH